MVGALLLVVVKGTLDIGGISVVLQRNLDSDRIEPPKYVEVIKEINFTNLNNFFVLINNRNYTQNSRSKNHIVVMYFRYYSVGYCIGFFKIIIDVLV